MKDTCSVCGEAYQVPDTVSFTCPRGHINIYSSNTNEKLRHDNFKLRQDNEQLIQALTTTQKQATYHEIRHKTAEACAISLQRECSKLRAKCIRLEKLIPAKRNKKAR
jgi:hypothetical protein